jgi:hypothetical protein
MITGMADLREENRSVTRIPLAVRYRDGRKFTTTPEFERPFLPFSAFFIAPTANTPYCFCEAGAFPASHRPTGEG